MRRPSRRISALALGAALVSLGLPGLSASALSARVAVAHAAPIPAGDAVVTTPLTTTFDVVLAQPRQAALTAFLAELSDPASPNYRHFLTTRQFARDFGAPASAVAALRRYFTANGLHVLSLSAGHLLMKVRGSSVAVARAFAAPVAAVRTARGLAAQFTATATLPRSLAHLVRSVVGLSSVTPAHPVGLARAPRATTVGTCPSAGANSTTPNALGGYTVNQQANLYGLSPLWAKGDVGVGQTIAVYELAPYSTGDVNTFFSCYSINPSIANVTVDGGATGAYDLEPTFDVEEAAALAPGAQIRVYLGPNNSAGPTDVFAQIADDNVASIVSTSWGDCEIDPSNDPTGEQSIFEQMAAQGQTVFASAGDTGSSDCAGITSNAPAVDDPASQPFVTGVGGLTVSSISPLSQTVWNDGIGSNGGAGGGGVSTLWSRPTWQTGPGISTNATMRMVPDLSVMADPSTGFIDYYTGNPSGVCTSQCDFAWSSIGGTSVGPPLMSAVIADAAQSCGVSRLGFLNPTFYAMARAGVGFNDVTTGNNDLFGVGAYSAGIGYDMASGLGSPSATTFAPALCPVALDASTSSLVASAATVVEPASVTLTLTAHDAHNNAIAGAAVHFAAATPTGTLEFDGQRASSTADGVASWDVVTNASGVATVTVTSSDPGKVDLSATYGATTLTTSVTFSALVTSPPGRASVAKLVARVGGFTLTAGRPASPGSAPITSYQYTITKGRVWVKFSAATRTVTVTHLARGATYHVAVRALNTYGPGAASAPATVRTH